MEPATRYADPDLIEQRRLRDPITHTPSRIPSDTRCLSCRWWAREAVPIPGPYEDLRPCTAVSPIWQEPTDDITATLATQDNVAQLLTRSDYACVMWEPVPEDDA